jgi:phosphoglycolate phosphatase
MVRSGFLMMNAFKAVIFDLDGTLLDTIEDLADAVNLTMANSGYPTHSIETYKHFVGDGFETLIRRALPEKARTNEIIQRHVITARNEYAGRWQYKTRPYPGIPALLDALSSLDISMAVLSNKSHALTCNIIPSLLPRWTFEIVLGAKSGVPQKPDPTAAMDIAGILGLKNKEIIFIGDSDVDMQTADAAGMYAVGALWGFRSAEELFENGARMVAATPFDLRAWFQRAGAD